MAICSWCRAMPYCLALLCCPACSSLCFHGLSYLALVYPRLCCVCWVMLCFAELCCAELCPAELCSYGLCPAVLLLDCLPCRYISDLNKLKNFGACLHLCPNPPAAVIVDNLSQLTRNTRQANCHVAAMLLCSSATTL